MNKTLMLVICDFLLLSMLALARFDPPEEPPTATLDATASAATAEAELIELLEQSLEAEQGSRENLAGDLVETRKNLQEQARLLAEREAALDATRTDLAATQDDLAARAAQAEQLAQTKAQLEATRDKLTSEQEQLAARFESTRQELEQTTRERIDLTDTLGQLQVASSVSEQNFAKPRTRYASVRSSSSAARPSSVPQKRKRPDSPPSEKTSPETFKSPRPNASSSRAASVPNKPRRPSSKSRKKLPSPEPSASPKTYPNSDKASPNSDRA